MVRNTFRLNGAIMIAVRQDEAMAQKKTLPQVLCDLLPFFTAIATGATKKAVKPERM